LRSKYLRKEERISFAVINRCQVSGVRYQG
jgi:hypothetical protein